MPNVHGLQEGEIDSEPRFLVSNQCSSHHWSFLHYIPISATAVIPAPFLFMMIPSPFKIEINAKGEDRS